MFKSLFSDPEQEYLEHLHHLDLKFGMCNDGKTHRWKWIDDWEGDPSVPRGVHDLSEYRCTRCGLSESDGVDEVGDADRGLSDGD